MSTDKCERCGFFLDSCGYKFCKDCRQVVLKELEAVGYLKSVPQRKYRNGDQMEDIMDTKRGADR